MTSGTGVVFGHLSFGDGSAESVIADAIDKKTSSAALHRRKAVPSLSDLVDSAAAASSVVRPVVFKPTLGRPVLLATHKKPSSSSSTSRRSRRSRRRAAESSSESSSSISSLYSSSDEQIAKDSKASPVIASESSTNSNSSDLFPGVKVVAVTASNATATKKSKKSTRGGNDDLLQFAAGDVLTLVDTAADSIELVARHDGTLQVGTVLRDQIAFYRTATRLTCGNRRRDTALYELKETEELYVEMLRTLARKLAAAARQAAVLPAEQLEAVFGDVDVVLAAHEAFARALGERLAALDEATVVGDVVALAIPTFTADLAVSADAIDRALHEELFSNLVRQVPGGRALLRAPLLRIAQLDRLLRELVAATPATHADAPLLVQASAVFAAVLVEGAKRSTESRIRLRKLARALGSAGEGLAVPQRQLLSEVSLVTIDDFGREESAVFLLFNDCFLVCKKNLLRQLRLRKRVDLSHVRVPQELTLKLASDCGLQIAYGPKRTRHLVLRHKQPAELCALHAALCEAARLRRDQVEAQLGLPVDNECDSADDDDAQRSASSRRMPRSSSSRKTAAGSSSSSSSSDSESEHDVKLPERVRVAFVVPLARDLASGQPTWRVAASDGELRALMPLADDVDTVLLGPQTAEQARQFEALVARPARVVVLGDAAPDVVNVFDGMMASDGGPLLVQLPRDASAAQIVAAVRGDGGGAESESLPSYDAPAAPSAELVPPPPPPPPPAYESVVAPIKAAARAYDWSAIGALPHFVGPMDASDVFMLLREEAPRTAVLRVSDSGERVEIAATIDGQLVFMPVVCTHEDDVVVLDSAPAFFVASLPHELSPTVADLLPLLALTPFVPRQFHQFCLQTEPSPMPCVACHETVLDAHLVCRQCFRVVHVGCAPLAAFAVCVGIALSPAEVRLRLCRRVFDELDAQRSGFVTVESLERLLHNVAPGELERVVQASDVDGDARLDFAEFHALLKRRFVSVFDQLDTDDDGLLSVDEIAGGLARVGAVPQKAVDEFVRRLAGAGTRFIDFRQFVLAFFVALAAK